MKRFSIYLFLFIAIIGCKEEFEPNADWKQVTVVYGVLDKNQNKQYIKVTKAFQNRNGGDAVFMAKNPDSLYHDDSIKVELQQLKSTGEVEKSYTLTKEWINGKEEGVFYSGGQYLYTIPTNQIHWVKKAKYKVLVTNLTNGKKTYATTNFLNDLSIIKPTTSSNTFSLYSKISGIKEDQRVIINKSEFAEIYEIELNFTYKEILNQDTTLDTIPIKITTNLEATENTMNIYLSGGSIFNSIVQNIDTKNDDPNLIRDFADSYMNIIASTYEMSEYIKAENNYSAISQTKPFYSNVFDEESNEKTAGLFANRIIEVRLVDFTFDTKEYIIETYPDLKFQ